MCPEWVRTGLLQTADDMERRFWSDCRCRLRSVLVLRAKIGFIEYKDGCCPTLLNRDQIPFDAPNVEVAIQSADQEHRIDIGGDELPSGWFAGSFA
jgi:hypothetical protein